MTKPIDPSLFDWVKDIGLPIVTFMAGFATARWTLTKKDRLEFEQKNLENTNARIGEFEKAYEVYTQAIELYASAPNPDASFFVKIAVTGDSYITTLNRMSSLILSGKADVQLRDDVLLPKIRAAVSRTIPQHYNTLKVIADKHNFPFNGEERRAEDGAIYSVVEKFGPGPDWSA